MKQLWNEYKEWVAKYFPESLAGVVHHSHFESLLFGAAALGIAGAFLAYTFLW